MGLRGRGFLNPWVASLVTPGLILSAEISRRVGGCCSDPSKLQPMGNFHDCQLDFGGGRGDWALFFLSKKEKTPDSIVIKLPLPTVPT